ncbi:ADP-ribosyltransferase [Glycomyces buryatensis]|uniref:ADP ribosyltransferase domain-containing protein n=1 Tax=Glycomyces buryatensis TaxID=2570927 RepID=A0A4S8PSS1_9ACTN|nr:ADP-ribosyltransferase [Glycomyces buryatensis]THV34390.1 hypothetical protein FAB82_24360 [Glycomyces buryatensis]
MPPTFQQAVDADPTNLNSAAGKFRDASDRIDYYKNEYNQAFENLREHWQGDDYDAFVTEANKVSLNAANTEATVNMASGLLQTLGATMKISVELLQQIERAAKSAGFKVLPLPLVIMGPTHWQQVASAGPAAPAVLAGYQAVAAGFTISLQAIFAQLIGQDVTALATLQGITMNLRPVNGPGMGLPDGIRAVPQLPRIEPGSELSQFTELDEAMVKFYTTDEYDPLNKYLRRPGSVTDPVQEAKLKRAAEAVSQGLQHLPPHRERTYRGVKDESFLDDYQVGAVVPERSFTSSSTEYSVAEQFASGGPIITVDGRSGRYIREYSDAPEESEVVFDRGTSFLVTERRVNPDDGRTYIRVEEVAND